MPYIQSQPDAELRSFLRRRASPHGIGAAAWIDETEPDRDGMLIRIIIADGQQNPDGTNRHRHMLVGIPRLDRVDQEELERAVERRAGITADDRLVELAARYEDRPLPLQVEWCSTCSASGHQHADEVGREGTHACLDCAGRGYYLN